MKKLYLAICVLLLVGCRTESAVQDGDIIFHTSQSSQSQAIQRATHSKYSHVGMIMFRDGKPYVFEAVHPVKYTPLQQWIDRGRGGHYVVKRLKNSQRVLTNEGIPHLKEFARQFEGKPYDLTFEWSDDRIYCSELIWKMYKRALGIEVGQLQKLGEFDLSDPVVKQKVAERFGTQIPFNETVISPQAIFDSPNLVTVEKR